MDWSTVRQTPKYNPRQFKLAREVSGFTKTEYAKEAGIAVHQYSAIEKGEVVPTEEQVVALTKAAKCVVQSFFEQWPHTEPDFSWVVARPIPIDYYQYKIFRDCNPPRLKAV